MDHYTDNKDRLLALNDRILALLNQAETVNGRHDNSLAAWKRTCSGIGTLLTSDMLRVAVVGPIKSGKSTFSNALLKGDYLKRGAGIVTCIITKIRRGSANRALLHFKSWDSINAEVENALTHFPHLAPGALEAAFDIRRHDHRLLLQQALAAMDSAALFQDGTRTVGSVLLACYLRGYDRISALALDAHPMVLCLEADAFERHQHFVSEDALSVYLQDVQLEIATDAIDAGMELADCQGSDSPNPLHLAMIQRYLIEAHLIVYVISSRTGIRQADVDFLTIIKKMGLMDSVLFVVNVDFTEHDGRTDLEALVAKVTEELALLKPDPDVFAFSALYNLFAGRQDSLGEKDGQRFAQWGRDGDMVALSDGQTARFAQVLRQKLTRERGALLLKNHLEHLAVTLDAFDHWVGLNLELCQADAQGRAAFLERIAHQRQRIGQVSGLLKTTFSGATQAIKQRLRQQVDHLFCDQNEMVAGTFAFIRNYTIDPYRCSELLAKAGFAQTLYLIFQEFRQSLETHLATMVNPEIFRFVGRIEEDIYRHLVAVTEPHLAMVAETLDGLKATPDQQTGAAAVCALPLPETIKQITGLHLEPASASLRFSARVRTEALFKLGFYAAVRLARRVFKKSEPDTTDDKLMALRDGVWRMKRETEEAVRFHFKNYRENVKFQYLFKLVDASADVFHTVLIERFEAFGSDFEAMAVRIDREKADSSGSVAAMGAMRETFGQVRPALDELRRQLQRL